MKLLQFVSRFRAVMMLAFMLVFFTLSVLAQPDPLLALQNIPAGFNWVWMAYGAAGMVLHWLKQVIWKEKVSSFDEHFFTNAQWTLGALLVTFGILAAQTDALSTLPLFSVGVIVPCLIAGFTADSGLNSPGTAVSTAKKNGDGALKAVTQ